MAKDSSDNVIHVNFGAPAQPQRPDPPTEDVDPAAEEKLRMFSELIESGTVMVTLDARRDGVEVPAQFADEFRLNLNFCHTFRISDFQYDLDGVRASLSFAGVDIFCEVPWTAVYMMRSHVANDVVLFPADLPPEMLAIIPEFQGGEGDEDLSPVDGELTPVDDD